jgi:hypothetical protein
MSFAGCSPETSLVLAPTPFAKPDIKGSSGSFFCSTKSSLPKQSIKLLKKNTEKFYARAAPTKKQLLIKRYKLYK